MQDYVAQKKTTLISFSDEGQGNATKNQKSNKLDANGVAVITEVISPAYRGSENISTKSEVFLNNGEINLFLQPIFRLLDFIF